MKDRTNQQKVILIGMTIFVATLGLMVLRSPANVAATAIEAKRETTDSVIPTKCDSSTLNGFYAVKGDGFVSSGPPPAPLVPFAVVSLMRMDGAGSLTDKANVSRNGQTGSELNTGTYSIGPDCTGTMTINIPNPPFVLNSSIVLTGIEPGRGAEGFFLIGSNAGSVVTLAATRAY